MARLVFNKGNLEQLREGLVAMLDLFGNILEAEFEHGVVFAHDDILECLEKIDQKKWRPIRNMFLLDPFYGYSKGNFSEDEKVSPAKIMLDFVNIFDQIASGIKNKLEHYQHIINSLNKEKTEIEATLCKTERTLRDVNAFCSSDKTEIKTAQATIKWLEEVVKEKNEKIADLQREKNVQLWEREKERIFKETDKKIKNLEKELAEQKKMHEKMTEKMGQMNENNKILKMKQDLAQGTVPPSTSKSTEELKRTIYLLEKDVIFLEQQLYTQQRTFATVLCGLKTDLLIISDNLTDPDTGQVVDKDFVRVCEITASLYNSMLEGDLTEAQKQLPPHYSYLPNDFKIKRIKRVSKSKIRGLSRGY